MSIIEFKNISKKFGNDSIFHNFNFSVEENEIVAIIGPSGSGKSTLLRMLMTLEGFDSGEIIIKEKKLPASKRDEKKIRAMCGMVFQQFNLFPHLSVLENITIAPLNVLKLDRDSASKRALDLLCMVGLEDKKDEFPSRLSGGQKQRVAIARALAMRPDILLLDEITSALDPLLVGEVLGCIKSIAQKHNLTILIVTHEMEFAREVADRVCFFDGGRVLEEGAPEMIFTNPKEERTREFLKNYLGRRDLTIF